MVIISYKKLPVSGGFFSGGSTDNFYIDRDEEDEELAKEIDSSDDYVRLPNQHELNEYEIMENFAEACPSQEKANRLFRALRGRKPFRHFKDAINEMGIADEYYAYRFLAYCKIAAEWCEENEIPYKYRQAAK